MSDEVDFLAEDFVIVGVYVGFFGGGLYFGFFGVISGGSREVVRFFRGVSRFIGVVGVELGVFVFGVG